MPIKATNANKMKMQKKRRFSTDEDTKLKTLVEEFGTKDWLNISKKMEGRNAKECKERWKNYLSQEISIYVHDNDRMKDLKISCKFQNFQNWNEQTGDYFSTLFKNDQLFTQKLNPEDNSVSKAPIMKTPSDDNRTDKSLINEVTS